MRSASPPVLSSCCCSRGACPRRSQRRSLPPCGRCSRCPACTISTRSCSIRSESCCAGVTRSAARRRASFCSARVSSQERFFDMTRASTLAPQQWPRSWFSTGERGERSRRASRCSRRRLRVRRCRSSCSFTTTAAFRTRPTRSSPTRGVKGRGRGAGRCRGSRSARSPASNGRSRRHASWQSGGRRRSTRRNAGISPNGTPFTTSGSGASRRTGRGRTGSTT